MRGPAHQHAHMLKAHAHIALIPEPAFPPAADGLMKWVHGFRRGNCRLPLGHAQQRSTYGPWIRPPSRDFQRAVKKAVLPVEQLNNFCKEPPGQRQLIIGPTFHAEMGAAALRLRQAGQPIQPAGIQKGAGSSQLYKTSTGFVGKQEVMAMLARGCNQSFSKPSAIS
jgi:hypothetical protein